MSADPVFTISPFAFLHQDRNDSHTINNNHRYRRGSAVSTMSHAEPVPAPALTSPSSSATTSPTSISTSTSSPSSPLAPALPVGACCSSPLPKLFKVEITGSDNCKGPNPVFYPGDIIHGLVHLYLDKPMTLPALKIVFRGESNYPASREQEHLDHHMRRLFSVAMTLWGSREPLPEELWGTLAPGNHIFPFAIQLPEKNLPASFDHPWVKNHYTLTAYYRRPNGLSKWQSKAKPINFMPLSTPGLEHGPIRQQCPKMGTALLLAHPDQAPGGRVHVTLTAGAPIDRCQFALSRHIRAKINENSYKEDEVICHYERRSIPKGEFNLVLPIPKFTPPTTEWSDALKITYSVQVSIWNERFFFKTESHNFDLPIVIRTMPSCDNRACEGLDWCEPSVDRPVFLTEMPMQPLPLYDADQSPPKYTIDLPSYSEAVDEGSTITTTSSTSTTTSASAVSSESAASTEQLAPRLSTSSSITSISSSSSAPLSSARATEQDQQSTPPAQGQQPNNEAEESLSDIEGHPNRGKDHVHPLVGEERERSRHPGPYDFATSNHNTNASSHSTGGSSSLLQVHTMIESV
ncbi:hypothetical protein DFQ26_007302 [Actinomortierella ambigua]|nr:hypothetical protein DFQ26_007302 [Actinomortierella ambigua]